MNYRDIVIDALTVQEKLEYIARHARPVPITVEEAHIQIETGVNHTIMGMFVSYEELVDMVYRKALQWVAIQC